MDNDVRSTVATVHHHFTMSYEKGLIDPNLKFRQHDFFLDEWEKRMAPL